MTESVLSRKLLSDTASQLVAKAVAVGASMVSVVLLTRQLGMHGYGTYAAALGFMALLSTVVDGGLPLMNVKRVANQGDAATRAFLGRQLRGRLLLSIIVCGAALLIAEGVFRRERVVIGAVVLLLPGVPALACGSTLASALQARSLLRRVAVIEAACRCTATAGFVVAAVTGLGLDAYLAIAVVVWFLQVIALACSLPASIRPTLIGGGPGIVSMYRDSAALGVAAVINVIYFRVDAVMVASIRGVDAAAGYAVAYRFLDMVLILPATFGATVLPALVRRGDDPEVLHRWANACIRLTLGFMVPVILVGILFAGPVMAVLGGRGFASSADVLRLLLIAGLFSSVDIMLGLLIVAAGLQGRMLWLNISALAANVIGNVILIPRFGGAGAAAMTGICEAAVMIVAVVVLRRTTGFAVRLRFDRREIAHVKVVLS